MFDKFGEMDSYKEINTFAEITAKVLEKYEPEGVTTREENVDGFKGDSKDNKQDSIRSRADNERNSIENGGNVGKTEENENIPKPQQSETEHETNNDIPEPITEKNVGYPEKPEGEKEQEKEMIAPAQKPSKPALIPSVIIRLLLR